MDEKVELAPLRRDRLENGVNAFLDRHVAVARDHGAKISRQRLDALSRHLGDANWLDGGFSAGDLLMVTVLRRLNGSGLLDDYPNLSAYIARGEARPAYSRAFDAQLAVFTAASTAG